MELNFLKDTELFKGIDENEISILGKCTKIYEKTYFKNELIFKSGDKIDVIALIIEGKVVLEHYDAWGNTSIVQLLNKHKVFGEAYALLDDTSMLFNVRALEDCKILFVEIKNITSQCPYDCPVHPRLVSNLMHIMAKRNFEMNQKIIHTSGKSIRSRIISYLSFESTKNNSNKFSIPFNRQQLADYLKVDRSALSNELSKMKFENLIDFKKNEFQIIGAKNLTIS